MRPSWRNKAAFSTLRCLFPVTRDSSVGWGTSQVGHLPITLQITARTSSSTWKILASNHSLALHKSSHSAALECFVQIWALGHEAVTFSALHLSFCPQASVCSCLTFDGHRPLLLHRRTQVSVPHGDSCISGRCSGFVMREGQNLPPSSPGGWERMAGSSHLARTKQKVINARKKDGINPFHALRENEDQFDSCPALGAAIHSSVLRLTLALKLSSSQTFFF